MEGRDESLRPEPNSMYWNDKCFHLTGNEYGWISKKKHLSSETYRLSSLPQIRVAAPSQQASWGLVLFMLTLS